MNGSVNFAAVSPPHQTLNGDAASSSSSSEVDFDPSAPETLQERVTTLSARVRQLKRKLIEAHKEIAALQLVVRENAAKELREKIDVAVQCHVIAPEGHGWTEVTEKDGEEAGISISDSIRDAANKVQQSQLKDELEQRGFVYEATSGFYYDPSSGYYYDAERQLYYDGNTQTYYSYNQDSGTYTAFAAAEEGQSAALEEEEERERGGKRRKKEEIDPEVERKLRKEKDKLLDGIFNLRKCREMETKKKMNGDDGVRRKTKREEEKEEARKKKRKKRTKEEKKATKSKWDDESDSSSGDEDDERGGKREKRRKKRKEKEKTERRKSEAEDGEISGSSSSSSSPSSDSSSEDDDDPKKKKKRRRKKKVKKKKKEKASKERSRDVKRGERTRERSRERDKRSDRIYGTEIKRDKALWTTRTNLDRDHSASSSYSDDDDERRSSRKRRNIKRGPLLYAEDDKRRFASEDHFPPCIRVIVVESDSIQVGSLFVVTKDGATIGSGDGAAIRVEEDGIAFNQASITYDMQERQYLITQTSDVTEDTLLNNDPLSSTASGATSITLAGYVRALNHGDVVGAASTRLLCHVHDGMDTCDECEPGQIMAKINEAMAKDKADSTVPSHASKQDWMRSEMKNLKKKFGLEKAAFEGPPPVPGEENYEDRAEQRRKKKGSFHPSHKKTTAQGASVKKALASTNKGHQLLSKMGWSEGKGLGKSDQGIVEPIQVGVRSANAGLGSESSLTKSMDEPEVTQKEKARLKAQQRFASILAHEQTS